MKDHNSTLINIRNKVAYIEIKNLILKILTFFLDKSLSIRKKIFIYLIKLSTYKYKHLHINISIRKEIENSHGIIMHCLKKSKDINNLTLIFSHSIFNNIKSMRRMRNCLDYWIPLVIQASKEEKRKFSIRIDSSDSGPDNYLNMDSEYKDQLIPDLYSMKINFNIDKNFTPLKFDSFKDIWLNKKSIIYWRGSTTGKEYSSIKELNGLKRIKICMRYKDVKELDIKISRIVQNRINIKYIKDWLISENIYSEQIAEEDFKAFKYYPDIPGNSLAWGTLQKYLLGNLVFKPYTKRKLLYYKFMEPWKDYIPVDEDFIDLDEKYKWVESHTEEAALIAWNGYIKAHDYIREVPKHFISALIKTMKIE